MNQAAINKSVPGISSISKDSLQVNADGSVDLYFAPSAPEGQESNWIPTREASWSVTLYDDKGWMPVNQHNAYSFTNVTAKKGKDGSITIRFGGDPKADNFLPIVNGWNYIVRLYRPKQGILDESLPFPYAQAVE